MWFRQHFSTTRSERLKDSKVFNWKLFKNIWIVQEHRYWTQFYLFLPQRNVPWIMLNTYKVWNLFLCLFSVIEYVSQVTCNFLLNSYTFILIQYYPILSNIIQYYPIHSVTFLCCFFFHTFLTLSFSFAL